MYCSSCGRKHDNQCHCLSQKPVSKIESFLILLVLLTAPIIVFTNMYQIESFKFNHFLVTGSLIFSTILLVISLLTLLLKKSYLALLFGCHQKAHRTLYLFKKPLNICSRCTGIYIGILCSIGYFMMDIHWIFALFLALPLMIDGLIQRYKSTYESNNIKRFFTGLLFGPLMIMIYTLYHYLLVKFVFYLINVFN